MSEVEVLENGAYQAANLVETGADLRVSSDKDDFTHGEISQALKRNHIARFKPETAPARGRDDTAAAQLAIAQTHVKVAANGWRQHGRRRRIYSLIDYDPAVFGHRITGKLLRPTCLIPNAPRAR